MHFKHAKRVYLMLRILTTVKQNNKTQGDGRKLGEVIDMFTTLIVVMI